MALSLTVTDNQDGTGAVATVQGSDAGESNVLYCAAWPGESWQAGGGRIGDGQVPLALPRGPWWAYVLSAGTLISDLVHFRVTDGTESIYRQCLDAVRDVIVGLALEGLEPSNIVIRKFAWNGEHVTPGIFCCPAADRPQYATNRRDDVDYPIQVVIVRAGNRQLTDHLNTTLLWREQIRLAFAALLRGGPALPGVEEVYTTRIEPGAVHDWGAFQAMWDIGSLTIHCVAREPAEVA